MTRRTSNRILAVLAALVFLVGLFARDLWEIVPLSEQGSLR